MASCLRQRRVEVYVLKRVPCSADDLSDQDSQQQQQQRLQQQSGGFLCGIALSVFQNSGASLLTTSTRKRLLCMSFAIRMRHRLRC